MKHYTHSLIKKILLLAIFISPWNSSTGQNFPFYLNCSTDFLTINSSGDIQRWSLSNGVVSGGDTLMSGGGTSLSYCGNANTPTFYTNNSVQIGINYYDPNLGWVNIPTYSYIDNHGGYLNHQFYKVEGAVIQVVKYWNGTNLITVDSLDGEFFAGTSDIAVDTLGQAWVFTGSAPNSVDSLKVYDQFGKINAYAFPYSHIAYGSFFLNDTLYVGSVQDSIIPVIISSGIAQFGNPIYFPSLNFTDMASCQTTQTTSSISYPQLEEINLYPNPTQGIIQLPVDLKITNIVVLNLHGQKMPIKFNQNELNFESLSTGLYSVLIYGDRKFYCTKIMKY